VVDTQYNEFKKVKEVHVMYSDFNGRVAIVTGGAGGIGKQTAIRLAQAGAKVCIADISEPAISMALEDFKTLGLNAIGVKTDVSERASVAFMVGKCKEAFGCVSILVNCAGIYKDKLFKDMIDQEWQQTMDINLGGVYNCCKEVVGMMIEIGYGKIINLTSQAGILGSILHSHYAASKAGIIGLTCSLARELADCGIYVNCVAPGIIETEMTSKYTPERREHFCSLIPLSRFGKPDEVAKVIAFLASDDSSYMTGQTINVTGGWLMHS
jgi:3-oxoacyl-[acyl-carrier protein] reductase